MRDPLRPRVFNNVGNLLKAPDKTFTLDDVEFLSQAIEIAWIVERFTDKTVAQFLDGVASVVEHILDCIFSTHLFIVYAFPEKGTAQSSFLRPAKPAGDPSFL